ncbi:MAG: single-stranded-DNA-specific exonuclease RecJ [Halanaerobacter sp.]
MEEEIWELREAEERVVTNLVTELDISSITARILANRGYDNATQVRDFLDCRLDKMHDPYSLQDMKKAVNRIKRAVDKGEKIVIYGDYDVDGITSTALLMDYLQGQGGEVDFYIPNRLTEGYGLNKSALRTLAQEETDLVITVDCGIKGHEEIALVNELDLDIIITDHHTVPPQLPNAEAVINPKRKDSTYPCAELAGVAVAFKLVQALELKQGASMPAAQEYLGLVTLGVIADIVPLRDENRIIANVGLEQLSNLSKEQPGLFALAEVAGCLDKEVSTGHIGFGMAPRINACGRLGSPELGVELLLSSSYQQAGDTAQKLDDLNDRRQQLSQEMQEEAESLIKQRDLEKEWVLVLASPDWHSGVIGNVASDLNEKYHRPIVLIAIEEGVGKGSARSISGFNIHDALLAQEEILESFGGHEQAAGLSVREDNIALLQECLNQYAHKRLQKSDLLRHRKVDVRVDLAEISFALIEELDSLAPFGYANPSPKLMVEGIKISDYKLVGNNKDHLKLTAQDGKSRIDGIAFSQKEVKRKLDLKNKDISLLFSPEINCWRGRKKLQLKIRGIKTPLSINE